MEKLLTVSVAAYNVEDYIKEVLEPFTQMEVSEYVEVLVIDDGGTDKTYEIARKFEEQFPGTFKVIHKENGGWGSTVNLGIKLATGKYFKLLDGDDFFERKALVSYIEKLKHVNADLIYTPYVKFDDNSGKVEEMTCLKEINANEILNIESFVGKIDIEMHCCTFNTDLLKKSNIRVSEKCYYTDIEYVLKAIINVQTVQFFDDRVYYYRISREGQSVSISGFRNHYKEHEKVVFSLLEYFSTLKMNHFVSKLISQRIKDLIDDHYAIYFFIEPTKEHRDELMEYDRKIKSIYNQYYNIRLKKIRILRKTHFIGYKLFAIYETRKKLKKEGVTNRWLI